ncbi:hypothetical protein NECID01_1751 [Nematocida sp. AWRm77]|nr:hypothetical protein NECID01_1751 [Nematocida sp. AWRm77]
MEPEVLIIELKGDKTFKVFSTGVSYTLCKEEDIAEHFEGKLHLFLLVPSSLGSKHIYRLAGVFFRVSQLDSISVMYSSVATSLALGIQNLAVVNVEYGEEGSVLCSVDLVNKSSLVCSHSRTQALSFDQAVDTIMESMHSSVYRESVSTVYIKGESILQENVRKILEKKGVFSVEEKSLIDEIEIDMGYTLAQFPYYFEQMMPHNMLPNSDISYVGAVLTTMINYFEIKEVNTREDFEAGITKHLVLN